MREIEKAREAAIREYEPDLDGLPILLAGQCMQLYLQVACGKATVAEPLDDDGDKHKAALINAVRCGQRARAAMISSSGEG
jgi:hypothetical protein